MIKGLLTGLCLFAANLACAQIPKVEKIIDACVQKENFNGAVLIAKGGRPFSETTLFPIFSLTKTFTVMGDVALGYILNNSVRSIPALRNARERVTDTAPIGCI